MVNSCGFPPLPAFLPFYLGAEEDRLPAAPTRVAQGLAVGALVGVGFLAIFALLALPVSYCVTAISDAIPWTGLATGIALAGVLALASSRANAAKSISPAVREEPPSTAH